MKKVILKIGLFAIIAIGSVYAFNYFTLTKPVMAEVKADSRNDGIRFSLRYKYFVSTNDLIFDLRNVAFDKTKADVFRVLLQTASALKERDFQTVTLSYRGSPRFVLRGNYFKRLGQEYGIQNPIYTMRTFPENVYDLNGNRVFGRWTGGLFGVFERQMEDFNSFHKKWYLNDMMR